jgi:hypothetical protein
MAPYTFLENIETEVPIPENGILSRTLFNDEALKVVAFGFSSGHELSAQEPSFTCRRKRPMAFWPRPR